MKLSTIIIDRFLTFIVGLVFLSVGGAVIAYRFYLNPLRKWVENINVDWFNQAPQKNWWIWGVLGIGLMALLLGLWILGMNLTRKRVGLLSLPDSDFNGELCINMNSLAAAVASDLEYLPGINSARGTTGMNYRHPKNPHIVITIAIDPHMPLEEIRKHAEKSADQIEAALPNQGTIHFLLHSTKL